MDEDAPSDIVEEDSSFVPGKSRGDDEEMVRERINGEGKKRQYVEKKAQKPCRTRFDTLATPNRRLILALYQNHAYHLPKNKVENLKRLLQELYAMTPEETERYFNEIKYEASRMARRKRLKEIFKKQYREQRREMQIARALKFVETILRKGMLHAFNNPVPPLVSVRLRNLSDIILEQICDLRNTDIPRRDDPTQEGLFLIAVADWMAIAVEHIYYGVQLKKNEEMEKIEKERSELEKGKKGSPPSAPKTETETPEIDQKRAEVKTEDEGREELEEGEKDVEEEGEKDVEEKGEKDVEEEEDTFLQQE